MLHAALKPMYEGLSMVHKGSLPLPPTTPQIRDSSLSESLPAPFYPRAEPSRRPQGPLTFKLQLTDL